MPDTVPLRRLYEIVEREFPELPHDSEKFLDELNNGLRDMIRNSSLRRMLQQDGMNLAIHRTWPLNDFYPGIVQYLTGQGMAKASAYELTRKLHEQDLLFEE